MLTVAAALEQILQATAPLETELFPLAEALGLVLSEDVSATIDSPPFDKSLMDGYAVRAVDLANGAATLLVTETVTAGRTPSKALGPGEAIQIMTGTMLPDGTDLVVKIEETERTGDSVRIATTATHPESNIIRRGTSVRAGDSVLTAGMKLNASRIGALAELGAAQVKVFRQPTVAIIATGDELVPAEIEPGPGQIRNSNQSMIMAQVQAAGAIPHPLGIARDDRDDLRAKIELGLQQDILVLSGGVSAGTLDLVPGELAAAGVRQIFHKVEVKPGKPIWFGVRRHDPVAADASRTLEVQEPSETEPDGLCREHAGGLRLPKRNKDLPRTSYVFGLPGNPVSSLVCFEIFVKTAIRRLMGESHALPVGLPARLEHAYSGKADRPTYHPASIRWTPEGPKVSLVSWHGSSDLCGTVAANGMAFLPGIARQYQVGDLIETFAW